MRAPRCYRQRTSNRGGLQSARRNAVLVLASALGLLMGIAPAAASASMSVAPVEAGPGYSTIGSSPVLQDSWEDTLYWYLVWIHQHVGGDPTDLDYIQTVQCMVIISDFYDKNGMPPGLTDDELAGIRGAISAIYDLLASPPPDYPVDAIVSFKATLNRMSEAIGGDAGALH